MSLVLSSSCIDQVSNLTAACEKLCCIHKLSLMFNSKPLTDGMSLQERGIKRPPCQILEEGKTYQG